MSMESNSFDKILKDLVDDFGGAEIFCEDNHFRLNKKLNFKLEHVLDVHDY